jgi:hypothetical protein
MEEEHRREKKATKWRRNIKEKQRGKEKKSRTTPSPSNCKTNKNTRVACECWSAPLTALQTVA